MAAQSGPEPAASTPELDSREIEAAVRRYLARIARRYAPAAVGLLALILVLVFVPTVSLNNAQTANNGVQSGGGSGGGSSAGSAGGGAGGPTAAGSGSSAGGFGTPVGSSGGLGGGGSGGTASATGGSSVSGGGGNVSKTNVTCTSGARQFAWSKYAPACVPAYRGNNGGATAPGVTGSTITLSYRIPNSAQQSAIDALAGAANINDSAYIADVQSYVNFFNSQFELYGRKVVLKPYNGQGDYIEEDQGQNLAAAQADAVTAAKSLGAFGDVTFSLEASEPYEQDLAQQHVISFSSVAEPHSWYEQYYPYEFSVQGAEGTVGVQSSSSVVCRRLAGLKAIYSGNAGDSLRTRTFGVIYPENPHYTEEVQQEEQLVGQCGVQLKPVIAYSINVAEYETESTQAVAQMKAAGVTTMLCACDPIFPILLTNAQNQQNYFPEIFTTSFGDPVGRDYNQTAWSRTIAGGVQFPPLQSTEAYKAYQVGYPGQHPNEWQGTSPPYFYVPYYTLLQVFDALQAAGPDLTPQSFARGEFSSPSSQPGDVVEGQWIFGNQVFDPISSFSLAWWDQNYVSQFDSTKGGYRWCNGGQVYDVRNLAALGGPGQQLQCFGH